MSSSDRRRSPEGTARSGLHKPPPWPWPCPFLDSIGWMMHARHLRKGLRDQNRERGQGIVAAKRAEETARRGRSRSIGRAVGAGSQASNRRGRQEIGEGQKMILKTCSPGWELYVEARKFSMLFMESCFRDTIGSIESWGGMDGYSCRKQQARLGRHRTVFQTQISQMRAVFT